MRAARLLIPLTVLALLAGCSGDAEEAEPTPDQAQAEDVRIKVESEDGEGGSADADAPDAELAACMIGEWTSDPAEVAAAADQMMAAMGMTSTTIVTGESTTTIDETTITTAYADQVTEMTTSAEGQSIVSTTRMNGSLSQPYTLSGDVMTSVAGDMSGVQMESSVLVNGQELPGYEEGFQEGLNSAGGVGQSGRNRVTCSGDTLTLTTLDMEALDMGDLTFTLTLTRR